MKSLQDQIIEKQALLIEQQNAMIASHEKQAALRDGMIEDYQEIIKLLGVKPC